MKRRLAARVRGRLSYATVVSAISLFLLVAGGAALAAGQLGKNSVGTKQLKKNSVTAAKIKKSAVTAAKIKKSAVTGAKLKEGSLGAESLDLGSTPYSRTVAVINSSGPVTVGEKRTPIPLANGTYSQPAGEDDFYVGTFTGTMPPQCKGPERSLFVNVFLDANITGSGEPERDSQILGKFFSATSEGSFTETAPLGPVGGSFQPSSATNHTLTAYGEVECEGATKTATVESIQIRVIGTK